MLKPEVKKLWVDALRSGEYSQGTGALKTGDKEFAQFCCLGVLCDIHAKMNGKEWEHDAWTTTEGNNKTLWEYLGMDGVQPGEVDLWAGIDTENGDGLDEIEVEINGNSATLWMHNDRYKATFEQIAKAIEDQL